MLRSLRVPMAVFASAMSLWLALPRADAQSAPGAAASPTTVPPPLPPRPTTSPTPVATPIRTMVFTASPASLFAGQAVTFALSPVSNVSNFGITFGDGSAGSLALVPGTQMLSASHAYAQPAPNGYRACVVRPTAIDAEFVAPPICTVVIVSASPTPSPSPTQSPSASPAPMPSSAIAPNAYVIVTFPDGSHAASVPYGGIAPSPYAQIVSETGGRAVLQWSVDGVVVTTQTVDVLAHAITRVDYRFMLPVGGNHTLVAALLPVANVPETPDPRSYVRYGYAAQTFASTNAGAQASHITITAPPAAAYVSPIDDALRFAWSEDVPGTSQDFIVRFLDPGGVQIATAEMGTAKALVPDIPLKKRIVAAATAGKSTADRNDVFWEVDGIVTDERGVQRLVASSDRMPLAATDAAGGLDVCTATPNFARGASAITFVHVGMLVSMLGRLDLTASPYAATFAPSQNDGYVRLTNVLIDWGDGSIEPFALRTKDPIDERAGPLAFDANAGPGHRYAATRDYHARVFEIPGTPASPNSAAGDHADAYAAACATVTFGRSVQP